ncbi:hypothetical protein BT96DRAFT_948461 [Gymnopus androsaceus JB14]|uniref:Uncharacterized protein n=1 Tax=Gymnopus androsaceus JB14 TaxID=1447944 RepID=A0A6A4GPC3_9AGAR|nr:hypothetical protein BT96DRAFT_948461 [Gymnopus androsaceus JB14]
MPNNAFTMKWRLPTPVLNHIKGGEEAIFEELIGDEEYEDESVDGSELVYSAVEEGEDAPENVYELEFISDNEYMPGVDSEEESEDNEDVDTEPSFLGSNLRIEPPTAKVFVSTYILPSSPCLTPNLSAPTHLPIPKLNPSEVIKAVKAILTGAISIPDDVKFANHPNWPKSVFVAIAINQDDREKLQTFIYVVKAQWFKLWPIKPVEEGCLVHFLLKSHQCLNELSIKFHNLQLPRQLLPRDSPKFEAITLKESLWKNRSDEFMSTWNLIKFHLPEAIPKFEGTALKESL